MTSGISVGVTPRKELFLLLKTFSKHLQEVIVTLVVFRLGQLRLITWFFGRNVQRWGLFIIVEVSDDN